MNVLFLSIGDIPSIRHREIYPDLLRAFIKNGHKVYAVCAREKRKKAPTELVREDGAELLKVKIGNITKTNVLEKGISTILINNQFKAAIQKYYKGVKFDLIMYSTPPITLVDCIKYVKKMDGAKTYLLLKDIFPQNAIDLQILSKNGLKGVIYKYFRKKEKELYRISDRIGCMSPANVDYVIKHNSEVNPGVVEVFPNCIEVVDKTIDTETRTAIRKKYKIPLEKKVFVYGGNLGKPQGIPFLIDCLKSQRENTDSYFLIVGDGTEFNRLNSFIESDKQPNVKLMQRLPKDDFDTMLSACDVGLIFLDHRFTIPNFPSRIISYMQANLPIVACTDTTTDIRELIEDNGIGWWCESNDSSAFARIISEVCTRNLKAMGKRSFAILKERYNVDVAYQVIAKNEKYEGGV